MLPLLLSNAWPSGVGHAIQVRYDLWHHRKTSSMLGGDRVEYSSLSETGSPHVPNGDALEVRQQDICRKLPMSATGMLLGTTYMSYAAHDHTLTVLSFVALSLQSEMPSISIIGEMFRSLT